MDAFFEPDGDGFVATPLTRGPWDERYQHGGPPCALLATAMQKVVPELALAMFHADFLRPVPIRRLTVEVEVVTAGRTVTRLAARLIAGRDVLRASALFVRRQPTDPETFGGTWPAPEGAEALEFSFFPWDVGYHKAVDVRILDPPWGRTPVRCWGRSRVPLIRGEPVSAEAHTIILADAESGMGPPIDPHTHTYVNPDLTVYFGRSPRSGWVGLDIRSFVGDAGAGLSEARLRDQDGVFGRSAQSLVVSPR